MKREQIGLIYRGIGEAIKRKRTNHNPRLKQDDMAGIIGLSRTSVVNIEKGRHHLPVHVLYDIAHALSCSPVDLLPVNAIIQELPKEVSNKLKPGEEAGVAQIFALAGKEVNNDKSARPQIKGSGATQKRRS